MGSWAAGLGTRGSRLGSRYSGWVTVWIFDENLLWSSRLKSGVTGLGHEAVLADRLPEGEITGDIAIVNLGSQAMPPAVLVPYLRVRGFKVLAHAGHKEQSLLELGRDSGADLVVTNGELTHKLGDVLTRLLS